jgi:hypothetical protein
LLTKKYLHSKTLSRVSEKPTDSPFWKDLMKVKEEFLTRGSFVVGNGMNTRFLEDIWLGDVFVINRRQLITYLSFALLRR